MSTIHASIDLSLDPSTAFDAVLEDLVSALDGLGISFEPAPDGRVLPLFSGTTRFLLLRKA